MKIREALLALTEAEDSQLLEIMVKVDDAYKACRQNPSDFAPSPSTSWLQSVVMEWHDAMLSAWSSVLTPIIIADLSQRKVTEWIEAHKKCTGRLVAFSRFLASKSWVAACPKTMLLERVESVVTFIHVAHRFVNAGEGDDHIMPNLEEAFLSRWRYEDMESFCRAMQAAFNGFKQSVKRLDDSLRENGVAVKATFQEFLDSPFFHDAISLVNEALSDNTLKIIQPYVEAVGKVKGLVNLDLGDPFGNVFIYMNIETQHIYIYIYIYNTYLRICL